MDLIRVFVVGAAALVAGGAVAQGELVKLTVSGVIANSTYAGRDFDEGDPFTAMVTIDTDTPVNPSPAPSGTTSYYSNAIKSVTVTSLLYDSTYADPAGMGRITVVDGGGAGQDWVRLTIKGGGPLFDYNTQPSWQPGTTTPLPNPGYLADLYVNDLTPGPEQFKVLEITLGTFNSGFITDGKLPTTFNGFDFDQQQGFNIQGRAGNSGLGGHTLAVASQIVPEPTSLSLVGLAGTALLARRRR